MAYPPSMARRIIGPITSSGIERPPPRLRDPVEDLAKQEQDEGWQSKCADERQAARYYPHGGPSTPHSRIDRQDDRHDTRHEGQANEDSRCDEKDDQRLEWE